MKVEEWDSQTSEEEKDKVILTSLYNDLLGRTPQFDESPKSIETEDNEKTFDGNFNGEKESMVCNCESDGKEETREEEMSNFNEYGITEIERNKRLESLIARRRARRLFKLALNQRNKLQAGETTSSTNNNNNTLQITVSRNKNRNYSSDNNTIMGVQMPGSAPSVLLQGRNPFDIPYDPQEERPNLTGDSFDEEFSMFNHQDMLFCRHESFCRFSLFSPQHTQCMNSPASTSEISTMRKRLDLDNEYMDHTERSVENGKNEEKEVELNEETYSNKEEGDDSSSSEESESELSHLNSIELRETICHSMDNYPGFVVNQTRSSTIPSQLPKATIAPRLDDNNIFYTRRCANSHGRTFSIASDMQVEVSEIGSPPTTVDWLDDWSNGGESYTYDTDIDREIVYGEETRNRLSDQYESRSGIGSKEESNGSGAKLDHKCVVDENLRVSDDTSLLDRNVQTKEDVKQVAVEVFEQKRSSSSDMFKRSNSGKFEGLLFHTSVSLSSITEEPETVLDSIDGGNLENLNYITEESADPRSLVSINSSMKKLIDAEPNDDLCGSPNMIDLGMINHQQCNNIQGEHVTKINVNKFEKMEPEEYEASQSFLDASLDSSYIKSYEREMEEEDEPNIGVSIGEKTKHPENEALQSDLESSPSHVLIGLLESEVIEENRPKLLENVDEKVESAEQKKTQIIFNISSSHPHTYLLEDDINIENSSNVSFLQVQKGNRSTLDNSSDQEIHKEGESSGLIQDLCAKLTEEHNNDTSVGEESIVSTEIQNLQDSQSKTQQCGINSSEWISPRTLEVTQQLEHEDVIVPNTVVQKIEKNEFVTLVEDSAGKKNNDEENLQLNYHIGEAIEKKLDLALKPIHESSGLVASKDDEESKKSVEVMGIAQAEATKDDNRVSDDINIENGSNVRFLQVQKGNSSTVDNSSDQEIHEEEESSGLIQDLYAKLTEKHNNGTSFGEESTISTEIPNLQDSQSRTQQCGINSSEGISPRILDVTQQLEHEDVIVPNTVVQNIEKNEFVTLVEDSAGKKNNDEENLQLNYHIGEAIEEKLDLALKPMHDSSGLVARRR
ncbi:unnamed protein product [Arabis nemorensis]|uniref:Uncharacterized protein n=1 Tax=Arabis nemorensis TaxID=586526 RepID=A0A565CS03_9BRAS|nr:unnamed protein product [Arabis nemorensis]